MRQSHREPNRHRKSQAVTETESQSEKRIVTDSYADAQAETDRDGQLHRYTGRNGEGETVTQMHGQKRIVRESYTDALAETDSDGQLHRCTGRNG